MSSSEGSKNMGGTGFAEGKLPVCADAQLRHFLPGTEIKSPTSFASELLRGVFGSGAWGWGTAYSIKS